MSKVYQTDPKPILEINRVNKKSRLSEGMNLLIPLPKGKELKPASTAMKKSDRMDKNSKPIETIYTIKKGDTLSSIAKEMGVNTNALSRWNNLHPEKILMPGDRLKLEAGKIKSSTLN